MQNNLEFFSDSSSENPLYKNVEKQINDCQSKVDEVQEEYIRLKQIKNAQIKRSKLEQAEEESNQELEEDLFLAACQSFSISTSDKFSIDLSLFLAWASIY